MVSERLDGFLKSFQSTIIDDGLMNSVYVCPHSKKLNGSYL